MDIAVNPPMSGTESQHLPFDGVNRNTEPSALRRHNRYSSPEAASPRRLNDSSANNSIRSSTNGESSFVVMNRTSPSISPFVMAQVRQDSVSGNTGNLPEVNGQNHDRMETDDVVSVRSEVEHRSPEGLEASGELSAVEAVQLEDGEIMDTTPDSPAARDGNLHSEAGQVLDASTILLTPSSTDRNGVAHMLSNDRTVSTYGDATPRADGTSSGVEVSSARNSVAFPPLAVEAGSGSAPAPPIQADAPRADGELFITDPPDPPRPAVIDPVAPLVWDVAEPRGEWSVEREEESQDEDSTDDEDYPLWANIREDTSGPDEEELKAIEETMDEISALDHEHWENLTYEVLKDPEYIPGESGRITWTVQGVNGTPDKPNKEKIMRSPSVLIGGHYWNIKYYPRGNDGTEQLSVYIECSNAPYEEKKSMEVEVITSAASVHEEDKTTSTQVGSENLTDDEAQVATNPGAASQDAELPVSLSGRLLQSTPTVTGEGKSEATVFWEVAAQVSCIIHNPDEPRVHVYQKSSHRYYNDNPDWGWTRFHGPWNEIHKRQRFQRQALLRNDRLTFTAYIRTVQDDTRALWWHPPKEKPEWDSVARVGFKRLVCGNFQSSALIAALSTWLYLAPITDILSMRHLNVNDDYRGQSTPLADAFQQLFRETLGSMGCSLSMEPSEASLGNIASILRWYGEDFYNSKMDVVATWETLRRTLNLEASGGTEAKNGRNFFRDVLTLRQVDLPKEEQSVGELLGTKGSVVMQPSSVLETVKRALSMKRKNPSVYQQAMGEYPSVLQVELQRQKYVPQSRRWKKLTHKIRIDETLAIDLPFSERTLDYTLYGMIVHTGDLESNDYYSVIRPGGPGSFWVKYASDRDRKGVTRLTTKQAIAGHEGTGEKSEGHEGTGEKSEGSAAVAYIVMYVRTDSLSQILSSGMELVRSTLIPSKDDSKSLAEEVKSTSDQEETVEKKISVRIYQSDLFRNHAGKGILNPWVLQNSPSLKLEFARSTTLVQLERYLVEQNRKVDKHETFRLWALDNNTEKSVRGSPLFISSIPEVLRLDEVARSYEGCHFWLHVIPPTEVEEMTQRYEVIAEEPPVMPALEQPPAARESAPSDQDHSANGSQDHDVQDSQNGESLAGAAHENADEPSSSLAEGSANDEDTIMDEAQDIGISEEPVPPVSTEASLSWISGTQSPPKSHVERIYFFLKVFDCQNQTLRGVGGFFAKQVEKIGDVVRRVLSLGPDEAFDIFHEISLRLREKHRVRTNSTFRHNDNAIFPDGSIFIVQLRASELEIVKLEAEGKCTNPIDFFTWLHHQGDPSYLQDHRLESYFGSSYTSAAQKYGRPHGLGVRITMAGDAYSGNFVAGTMSGHGTMAFANGDTYTGQWKSNEPNGQGKMVYAKTGNIYIGGFRKRKRHGKGTMQFEVADEELQLCRICYEEEMDALFYDCGHVAACEACAKQVEICPVCRKSVRAVVRIWKT